jgi:ZIP family zinc transporter
MRIRTPMNTEALINTKPKRFIGILILVAGALVFGHDVWFGTLFHDPRVADALRAGMLAAAATALGTLPILFSRRLSDRLLDTLLGFGAGVMLAATAFSLILPALNAAERLGSGPWNAGLVVGAGILIGGLLLMLVDKVLPHEHFIKGAEGISAKRLRRTWLFVFAICLHNLPEGLAIGVAYGGSDPVGASALATGIAIQDLPEGLVVAVALIAVGYSRLTAIAIACASGLLEPIGAVLGASVVTTSAMLLPWGLSFAGGAMLFVISHEIIPESHRKGHERYATGGLMLGFVVMMVLDTALG